MNVNEILTQGGGLVLVILTLIQIAPIKINPWSSIGRMIGRALNADIIERLDKMDKKVEMLDRKHDAFERLSDEREAKQCRARILRFGDEILHGVKHSKEHFDQVLLDCTDYETFCDNHPNFSNNVAVQTIERIKGTYRTCLEERTFL